MPNLSLVIPATDHKGKESKKQLIDLLDSARDLSKEVNVVVSFDAVDAVFEDYFKENYPFIVSFNRWGNRLGFAGNSNIGLRYCRDHLKTDVILVNQDCILPAADRVKLLALGDICTPTPLKEWSAGMIDDSIQYVEVTERFPFFCPYISLQVMEELGFLCENFISSFEDDDYITRAVLYGFTLYKSNVGVIHSGSFHDFSNGESISGAYTNEILGLNLQKYIWKYQINVADIVHAPGHPQAGQPDHDKLIPWVRANKKYNKEFCYES